MRFGKDGMGVGNEFRTGCVGFAHESLGDGRTFVGAGEEA